MTEQVLTEDREAPITEEEILIRILKTYSRIRIGAALLGVLFPLVLLIVAGLESSFSAYYHTEMRDVFVGSLCAVGVILFLYKGVSDKEDIALNLAGIFAVLVALVPGSSPVIILRGYSLTADDWHTIFGTSFFLAIAFVCWFCASDTLHLLDPSEQWLFKWLYRLFAVLMVALPLLAVVLLYLFDETNSIVFFVELLATWVFGAYWIVKTIEIGKSQIEEEPIALLAR